MIFISFLHLGFWALGVALGYYPLPRMAKGIACASLGLAYGLITFLAFEAASSERLLFPMLSFLFFCTAAAAGHALQRRMWTISILFLFNLVFLTQFQSIEDFFPIRAELRSYHPFGEKVRVNLENLLPIGPDLPSGRAALIRISDAFEGTNLYLRLQSAGEKASAQFKIACNQEISRNCREHNEFETLPLEGTSASLLEGIISNSLSYRQEYVNFDTVDGFIFEVYVLDPATSEMLYLDLSNANEKTPRALEIVSGLHRLLKTSGIPALAQTLSDLSVCGFEP